MSRSVIWSGLWNISGRFHVMDWIWKKIRNRKTKWKSKTRNVLITKAKERIWISYKKINKEVDIFFVETEFVGVVFPIDVAVEGEYLEVFGLIYWIITLTDMRGGIRRMFAKVDNEFKWEESLGYFCGNIFKTVKIKNIGLELGQGKKWSFFNPVGEYGCPKEDEPGK